MPTKIAVIEKLLAIATHAGTGSDEERRNAAMLVCRWMVDTNLIVKARAAAQDLKRLHAENARLRAAVRHTAPPDPDDFFEWFTKRAR
jgi:hypothetical protein